MAAIIRFSLNLNNLQTYRGIEIFIKFCIFFAESKNHSRFWIRWAYILARMNKDAVK